jgi:hypothetical protein
MLWNTSAPFPESNGAVVFERGHTAKNSLVHEMGEAPLHSLFDLGASEMGQLSNVTEDRLGKVSGLFDVPIDTRVTGIHGMLLGPTSMVDAESIVFDPELSCKRIWVLRYVRARRAAIGCSNRESE